MPQNSQIAVLTPYHQGCAFGLIFQDTLIVGRLTLIYPGGEVQTSVPTIDDGREVELMLNAATPTVRLSMPGTSSRGDFRGHDSYPITAFMVAAGNPSVCWFEFAKQLPAVIQAAVLLKGNGINPFTLVNHRQMNRLILTSHELNARRAA